MKPKLLDLFCGAGGASMGYSRAGFEVHGCDLAEQKRYPFPFIRMDWREYVDKYGHLFDAFAASPPCQGYSVMKHLSTKEHPMLIHEVRDYLRSTGKPYIIENVAGAKPHMQEPLLLCGSMFGLQTNCGAQLRRHRLFESNVLLMSPGQCRHGETSISVVGHQAYNEALRMATRRADVISVHGDHPHNPRTYRAEQRRVISVHGDHPRNETIRWHNRRTIGVTGNGNALSGGKTRTVTVAGHSADGSPQGNSCGAHNRSELERETFSVEEAKIAMGIDWMIMKELSQAIPPAYTQWLGSQLLEHCK